MSYENEELARALSLKVSMKASALVCLWCEIIGTLNIRKQINKKNYSFLARCREQLTVTWLLKAFNCSMISQEAVIKWGGRKELDTPVVRLPVCAV